MDIRLVSALEKIFPDGRGTDAPLPPLSALQGETIAFQLAIRCDVQQYIHPRVETALPASVTLRRVEAVPARLPRTPENSDENYLSLAAGMYPDVLQELGKGALSCFPGQWHSLFIELTLAPDAPGGSHPVRVLLSDMDENPLAAPETNIHVIPAQLPPQQLIHTEWFHTDCLADYYHVPVFSDAHWQIIGNFMETASKRGMTMILTPHFTPPLDTLVGGERTTVQLVDVEVTNGQYRFSFDKLEKWIRLAQNKGFRWFEFSHFFTQWGAKAAPKIMGTKDGAYQRLFGWDTPAVGGEYTRFLHAYLPQLTERLREWGVADQCYFHISDEPSQQHLESYLAAKETVEHLLCGFPIMDAISDYDIYRACRINPPVVYIVRMADFCTQHVSPLWGYYCCVPTQVMTNRFLQMPLARVRALGLQAWKYGWQGFLHWGYNFYNTTHSIAPLNPYLDTEAGGGLPAGDSFLVYPGPGGVPEESLRLTALHGAMQDLRALSALEALAGREKALAILDADGEVTLESYPASGEKLLALRQRINAAIARALE